MQEADFKEWGERLTNCPPHLRWKLSRQWRKAMLEPGEKDMFDIFDEIIAKMKAQAALETPPCPQDSDLPSPAPLSASNRLWHRRRWLP